jgi:hypothetical protein
LLSDVFSQSREKAFLETASITYLTNQINFSNAIVSAVFVDSAAPLISSPPTAAACFASTAASDHGDILAAGTSAARQWEKGRVRITTEQKTIASSST